METRKDYQTWIVPLEATGGEKGDDLLHVQRASLGDGTGLLDSTEGREDGLKKAGRSGLGLDRVGSHRGNGFWGFGRGSSSSAAGQLGAALGSGVSSSGSSFGNRSSLSDRGRGGSSGSALLQVDVGTNDGNLLVGTLEDHVHLHSHALSGVEMLAGQVEVELLQGEIAASNLHRSTLGDNLDGGSQVLEFGAIGHVGDLEVDGASGENVEGAGHHVDGGLGGSRGAQLVGSSIQSNPVQGTLCEVVSIEVCGF